MNEKEKTILLQSNEPATTQEKKKNSQKAMTSGQRKVFNSIFIVVFLLIFVGLNVLTVFLVNKFPQLEMDLTSQGAYSLQKTTEDYLNHMEEEITVMVLSTEEGFINFDTASNYSYQANQLLREMSTYDKVNVEYTDMSVTSQKTLQNKYPDVNWEDSSNMLLVKSEDTGKYHSVPYDEVFAMSMDYSTYEYYISGQTVENAVLSAVQRITSDKIVTVGFSVGNGEVLNANSNEYSYYSHMRGMFEDNAYNVEEINLLTQTPDEMDIILMIAPETDITVDTADALSQWLENDGNYGRTFFYAPGVKDAQTPNLDLFLEQWGIKVGEGFISETDLSMVYGSSISNMVNYAGETYTAGLPDTSLSVLMPYCKPIEVTDTENVEALLVSSEKAEIMITSEESTEPVMETPGVAQNAAVIATKSGTAETGSYVVTWGSYIALDAQLYTNTNFNNTAYFLNLMGTLSENELDGVVIESATFGEVMTVSEANIAAFRTVFVIIIPIALVVVGIVVWVRRRNR